ncbi:EF-P lysine aminoacylase GenX [Chlamydiota bacterium]
MSLASISKVEILKDRAALLARCRTFFAERGVLEVDVPILSRSASVDLHIDLVNVTCCGKPAFLHSSPEYGMKRLLADGSGDIYQISHVFRDGEQGERHTVEFMMAEWYRFGFSFQQMMDETLAFIRLFLDHLPLAHETFSYREAFMRFAGKYPADLEEREVVYAFEVEPHLGKGKLSVINSFPPEQAALSKIGPDGMAERFEVYYQGMELANGYHELTDAEEQRRRLVDANNERRKMGKQVYPIDEELIQALSKGIADCCGVAVGFDRLMMLRHQLEEIREASSFFV